MSKLLYDKVIQGWPVITAAPWTIGAIMLLLILIVAPAIWVALNWAYRSRLEHRNDQIASLIGQRDGFKEERDELKEKLMEMTSSREVSIGRDKSESKYKDTSFSNRLLQQDPRFDRVEILNQANVVRRTVYVSLRNVGNGFLSGCKLMVKECIPHTKSGQIPAALKYNFPLQMGQHEFIAVAWFDEKAPYTNRDIIFAVPYPTGFFGGWTAVGASPKQDAYTIALEATGLECGPCIKYYRLWVSEDQKLRMEIRLGHTIDSQVVAQERPPGRCDRAARGFGSVARCERSTGERHLRHDGSVPMVNSRDVARVFAKRHDHVLRDIANVLKILTAPDLGWFILVDYEDEKGEMRSSYDMTRDGFTLLMAQPTAPTSH